MAFADNFNRADGPLGASWTVFSGSCSISGNQATGAGGGRALCAVESSAGDQDLVYTVRVTDDAFTEVGALVKWQMPEQHGLMLRFRASYGGLHVEGYHGYPWYAANVLVANHPGVVTGTSFQFRVTWSGNQITYYGDGVQLNQFAHVTDSAHDQFGFETIDVDRFLDAFNTGDYVERSLNVTPDPVWVGGGPVGMTATGTNTIWTVGVPGSTTITVDHGEISDQWTESETVVRFTWTPAEYVGAVVFTESQYGLTDTINSTVVEPEGGNPCPCPFDAAFIATANATVEASSRGFPTLQTIIMPGELGWGNLYLLEAIRDIWYTHFRPDAIAYGGNTGLLSDVYARVWGGEEWQSQSFVPAGTNSLMDWLSQVYTIVNTMSQGNTLTLQTILDALGGGGATIQDVLDAIGTSWFDPDYTLHDDLDYLDNRSDHSLDQIQTRLGNIWGTDHWSLSQIVGAASDPQIESFASLHNIYARLQAMRGDTESSIANAEDWANLANTNAAAAHSAIDHMATVDQHTLQDVLDAIAGIAIPEPAPGYQGAPVWPGVGNATVYQPYNLTDGLTVQGPLHGLLFTITGQPAGAGRYRFGPHNSWTKTGAVIFTSDRGDHERAQQFGLDAHVICPKEMRIASSATLRLNTGWTGTVRRFLID